MHRKDIVARQGAVERERGGKTDRLLQEARNIDRDIL